MSAADLLKAERDRANAAEIAAARAEGELLGHALIAAADHAQPASTP